MTQITQDLLVLYQQRATGELVIMYKNQAIPQWKLYFYMGRLVYATGGSHPVRRWHRAFKKHAPELLKTGFPQTILSHEPLWELDTINQLLQEGLITSVQAKAIIQQIVQEVFFNLVEQRFLNSHWRPGIKLPHHVVFLSVEQMIESAQIQREAWRSSGLGYLQEWMSQFSPELAPLLRNPPPTRHPRLPQHLPKHDQTPPGSAHPLGRQPSNETPPRRRHPRPHALHPPGHHRTARNP